MGTGRGEKGRWRGDREGEIRRSESEEETMGRGTGEGEEGDSE